MKNYDILICNNDVMELPVNIVNTLQDAADWLQCNIRVLYNTMHRDNYMHYNGYKIELVKRDVS